MLEQQILFYRNNLSWADRVIRSDRLELLDKVTDKKITDRIINDIERISSIVGLKRLLTKKIINHLSELSKTKSSSAKVAEICCGNGWVLRALDERLARLGINVNLIGLDINEDSLHTASARSPEKKIRWERADAMALTMSDQSLDLIINIQSLHHFRPDQVARLMQEVSRVARRAYFFDLRRTLYGWLIVRAFRPISSREFIHDASLSHRRAYNIEEIQMIAESANVEAKVSRLTPVGLEIVIEGRSK